MKTRLDLKIGGSKEIASTITSKLFLQFFIDFRDYSENLLRKCDSHSLKTHRQRAWRGAQINCSSWGIAES